MGCEEVGRGADGWVVKSTVDAEDVGAVKGEEEAEERAFCRNE